MPKWAPGGSTICEKRITVTKSSGEIARPVFEWNHDRVMARGGEGIARLLGCRLLARD